MFYLLWPGHLQCLPHNSEALRDTVAEKLRLAGYS